LQLGAGYVFYDYHAPLAYLIAACAWVAFQVFPARELWGVERDEAKEEGGTGGVSFWANMRKTNDGVQAFDGASTDGGGREETLRDETRVAAATSFDGALLDDASMPAEEADSLKRRRSRAVECALLNVDEADLDVGRLEIYHPPVPKYATDETAKMIIDEYRLPTAVTPGNPELLVNQKQETGGPNRVGPPMTRDAQNFAVMQALDARQGGGRTTEP
jgi:hypothetical protein